MTDSYTIDVAEDDEVSLPLVGIQGPPGSIGPVGPGGPSGPIGLKGDRGEAGDAGPQGPEGPTGPKGDTGDTGPQGEQGPVGPRGDVGPTGSTGPKGDTGEQGIQGAEGPIGPPGPTDWNLLSNKPALGTSSSMDAASVAQLRSSALNKVLTADLIESASELVSLIDAAVIAVDWNAFVIGDLVAAGNRTIGNPSNVKVGVTRAFFAFGSNATERSLIWGSAYKGNLPDRTITSTRGLFITLTPRSAGMIAVGHVVLE